MMTPEEEIKKILEDPQDRDTFTLFQVCYSDKYYLFENKYTYYKHCTWAEYAPNDTRPGVALVDDWMVLENGTPFGRVSTKWIKKRLDKAEMFKLFYTRNEALKYAIKRIEQHNEKLRVEIEAVQAQMLKLREEIQNQ